MDAAGGRHRHQAQREAQRHHQQRFQTEAGAQHQHQLTERKAQVAGRHVDREHPAALARLGLLVEPALHHHELAHHAQTDEKAQRQPGADPLEQTMGDHRGGHHPAGGDIGAHVADLGDQPMTELAAQHQPGVVGGHQPAGLTGRARGGQTQGQVGGQQAGAEQHQQGGGVQRGKSEHRTGHASSRGSRPVPAVRPSGR
ncbi:hypothetical protein D3C81_1649090 [compost metagenome]